MFKQRRLCKTATPRGCVPGLEGYPCGRTAPGTAERLLSLPPVGGADYENRSRMVECNSENHRATSLRPDPSELVSPSVFHGGRLAGPLSMGSAR